MKKIIVVLAVLLVLAGCAQQSVQTQEQPAAANPAPQTVQQPQAAAPAPAESPQDSMVLGDDIKNQIESDLAPGVKFSMPVNFRQMDYGDAFAFGVGLQNIMNSDDRYIVKVYFSKAYDKYTNAITTNETMMNSWIKTNLDEFTLSPGQKQAVSIVIEAGEIMDGVRPKTGTYVFDVDTFQALGGYSVNKEVVGKKKLTIKI